MEEADALCSRVGIMVKGELRCIGSTQHLKNLYGAGYTLEMKLMGGDCTPTTPSGDRVTGLKEFVAGLFPDATLEESFADRLVFAVPQNAVNSLAECFSQLEKGEGENAKRFHKRAEETPRMPNGTFDDEFEVSSRGI